MKASRAILSVFSIVAFQSAVFASASNAIDPSLKQDVVKLLQDLDTLIKDFSDGSCSACNAPSGGGSSPKPSPAPTPSYGNPSPTPTPPYGNPTPAPDGNSNSPSNPPGNGDAPCPSQDNQNNDGGNNGNSAPVQPPSYHSPSDRRKISPAPSNYSSPSPGQQPPPPKPTPSPSPDTPSAPGNCPAYTPQLQYAPAELKPAEPPYEDGDLPYLSLGGSSKPNYADGKYSHSLPDIRFGYTLNTNKLDEIFKKVGLPNYQDFIKNLDKVGAFNDPFHKGNGSYLYLSVAAKFIMVNPNTFKSLSEMNHAYGTLKNAGLKKDVCTIKSVISYANGKTYNISDEQLIYLWGTNEHQNLHECAFGNADLSVAAHETSLCDFSRGEKKNVYPLDNKYDNVLTPAFGGCNDGGAWFQGNTTTKGNTQLEVTQRFLSLVGLKN